MTYFGKPDYVHGADMEAARRARHPVTGRFLAFDCEVDCLEHCAGLCDVEAPPAEDD